MSDKQTLCPKCSTAYKVTVAQLTIAQGMVCCPKCTTSFNALSHLMTEKTSSVTDVKPEAQVENLNQTQNTTTNINISHLAPEFNASPTVFRQNNILNIFDEKVENSNIDLHTYLNNLNYFSTEPINALPTMNWTEHVENKSKRSAFYFVGWGLVNLLLFAVLAFKFFWFNPQYLKNSHIMGTAFNSICHKFNCSNLEEHYTLINTRKIKITAQGKETQFSGELINYHDRSLAMPIMRVDLKHKGVISASYSLTPQEYLIDSLASIQRIPKNSPFKFQFKLPVERKSFDSYSLEIIRP